MAGVKPNGGDDIGAVHGIFETWTRHDAFPWNFFSPFFLQVSFKVELGGSYFHPFSLLREKERERERKGLGAVVATGVERFFTDSFLFIISQLSISFHVSWFIPLSFSLYLFFVLFSSFRDFCFFLMIHFGCCLFPTVACASVFLFFLFSFWGWILVFLLVVWVCMGVAIDFVEETAVWLWFLGSFTMFGLFRDLGFLLYIEVFLGGNSALGLGLAFGDGLFPFCVFDKWVLGFIC